MSDCSLRAREARGPLNPPQLVRDPDVLAAHLTDAGHFPGGHARELASPTTEAGVAALVRTSKRVLPIGAQSSLTGGATPMGETLLNTARMNRIESIGADTVRVEAGLTLVELDEALAAAGRYYPPVPTFLGACVGGVIATNAAGAATFKYGTTRQWVEAVTVVLASGDVLDIPRGTVFACDAGYFELELAAGTVRVPVPNYRMPDLPKLSAGYFARPGMDLVDLFIGSEGTLGVVTAATLRVLPKRPAFCLALVPLQSRKDAFALVHALRDQALNTWRTQDPRGIDVSAIEYMDARSLALLHEDGVDRANGIALPPGSAAALLVTLELPSDTGSDEAFDQIGRAQDTDAPDTPLIRFCRMLLEAGVLEDVAMAVPGDRPRAEQLLAIREGIPAAVNQRVARAQRLEHPRIEKTAGDMIVPFERLETLLEVYEQEYRRRGLDGAVWGHISDGNVHPNVIPRSLADTESGKEAILAFGREAVRLGGAPLAEHGVGRNPIKQQLLREFYGESAIDEMRAVKRALDPEWKLAPGVLFPEP